MKLKKAHEVINSPEKWTQGANARDLRGYKCSPRDLQARAWSLFGAMDVAYKDLQAFSEADLRLRQEVGTRFRTSYTRWNDAPGRKWEEVYGLLEELGI